MYFTHFTHNVLFNFHYNLEMQVELQLKGLGKWGMRIFR